MSFIFCFGEKKGVSDKRGQVGLYGLKYIIAHRPTIVILENVKGFLHAQHQHFRSGIKSILTTLGYTSRLRVLNTADLGIPQSRHRVYIVAIMSNDMKNKFSWPKTSEFSKKWLGRFLDVASKGNENCNIENYVAKYGDQVATQEYILDVAASEAFQSARRYHCPCLTRSRLKTSPTGFFIPKLRRRLSVAEAGKLQGWPTALLKDLQNNFSDSELGAALGDAMSVNVLGKVLIQCLVSIGAVSPEDAETLDPWTVKSGMPSAADKAWNRSWNSRKRRKEMTRIELHGLTWAQHTWHGFTDMEQRKRKQKVGKQGIERTRCRTCYVHG